MASFLRQRTEEGARQRYRPYHERARRQIERELRLIEKLDLVGYFLIVWDIARFCREQGILAQGRGSAANSAVCYALGITAVDPVGMDLLFERVLSEERCEWPDIDIDLPSGDQRERVIQYVYQRYGPLGAAMTANVIAYRGRSAAREIGKVLGFDPETVDRLARMVSSWEYHDPKETFERQFKQADFDLSHPRIRQFLELCRRVQDLPRHLGQHSGGMVIGQGKLDSIVPLEPVTMPGRTVVQWDKEDCANMGIIKVDLLGLGMMAVLEDSLTLIRDGYQEDVDLAHLPADDPLVYDTLQKADTVGMFQVESRAQMSCLHRLRPARFYDLVVEVAIIRPGPIVGKNGSPVFEATAGPGTGHLSSSITRAGARTHARRAAVSGTTAAHGDDRCRVHGRRSRTATPGLRIQALGSAHDGNRGQAACRDESKRHYRPCPGRDYPLDYVLCALRVSQIPCREFRSAGLRERLPEMPLSGRRSPPPC